MVSILREEKNRSYITVRLELTSDHWLEQLAKRLGKTKIDTFRDVIQPLYRASKVSNKVNMTVIESTKKPFSLVIYRFTKASNIEGENDERRRGI